MSDDVRTLREVNEGFYRAFESGRIEQMEHVWSARETDRCIHPGWPLLSGWEEIRESWAGIFRGSTGIRVELDDVDVRVVGDVAVVTCLERFSAKSSGMPVEATVVATNVYERSGTRWALVLHHGSPLLRDEPLDDEPKRVVH